MLGFSPEDVARASIYDGEKDFTATSGPIWVRFTNGTIPSNAVAQRCSGSENSLNECNVRMTFDYHYQAKINVYFDNICIQLVYRLSTFQNMIWEHDHHCDHPEDIVIECGGEFIADNTRDGFEDELDDQGVDR